MALHVPPVASETDAIHAFLAGAQDAFRVLLHGLTAREAAVAPSASSLSVGGLVKHVTATQHDWLDAVEAAPAPAPPGDVTAYLDGFTFRETDSLDDLLAAFDEVSAAVLDAVVRVDLDTAVPVPDAPWFPQDLEAWNVRWVWWHLMEELSRHAGHGDIVRETVDGATMYALVAARDGLPDLPWLAAWKRQDPPFTSGISTVRLHAADLPAATAWYAELLGITPYYSRDAYVEWRVGPHGHALGILDAARAPALGSGPGAGPDAGPGSGLAGGSVTYWQVEDAEAALTDLLARGATEHETLRDFGGDYRGAVVIDPFGNAVGIMQRPVTPPRAEPGGTTGEIAETVVA